MILRAIFFGAGLCLTTATVEAATIDFNSLPTGALLSNESLLFGSLTINLSPSDRNNRPVAVFDTDNPTGDNPSGNDDGDLQPNGSSCKLVDGGTVSDLTGGCPSSLGKALVIHEETPSSLSATPESSSLVADGEIEVLDAGGQSPAKVPDDFANGGSFTLDFDEAVTVASLGVIDIENSNSWVKVYTDSGNQTFDFINAGNASFQEVIVGVDNVTSLEIKFAGSGAVPFIALAGLDTDPTDSSSVPAPGALGLLLAGGLALAAQKRY